MEFRGNLYQFGQSGILSFRDGIQEDSGAFLRYSAVYALMEKAYVVIFAIYLTVCV